MTMTVPQNSYLRDFAGVELGAALAGPDWLTPRRQAAAARFAELGFPTRRDEEWRFTPVGYLADTPFRQAEGAALSAEAVAAFDYDGLTGPRLVFVNGQYAAEHSRTDGLPSGVLFGPLAAHWDAAQAHLAAHSGRRGHAFEALNTAALTDGAFLFVPRGVTVETPIHLLFLAASANGPTVSHPRTLIVAEDGAQATVVETYAGPDGQTYLTNAVTEIVCAENAHLDHYKVQREGRAATHIAVMQIELARGANFASHGIGLGGLLARSDANAYLGGERIECTLNGVFLARDSQLMDNHTAIDHALAHGASHEVYKHILAGQSRGVFNGKIFVHPDAQKTDAKQTNQALLLSPEAQIYTKPQLEIFADDVKCTHGATVGQLREDALFYLRARGIPEAQARALLIYAFASDIVRRIQVEPVRAYLDRALLSEQSLADLAE